MDIISRLRKWSADPFGRKQLLRKHDNILCQIHEATRDTSIVVERRSQEFPIANMTGDPARWRRPYGRERSIRYE